ncbi:MAG TPA: metallopeptidase family protein [Candidatus Paceibacterota bacterium]|nr:metallopeptidase family protein [Candidatus Paceibacterota bacterium]
MTRKDFEKLITGAVAAIPEKFRAKLENVVFIREDEPSAEQLEENGVPSDETLLGLFEGVTLGDRGSGPWELPSRIVIFQGPAEAEAEDTGLSVAEVVQDTVWHEVAHYLGMDEHEVRASEKRRKKRYNH